MKPIRKTCFVIQRFDNGGPYDRRFDDILKPAITTAGLHPDRTDRDPKTTVPIERIERGIRDAALCISDISSDSPNVWFETGYALALQRDVVLIGDTERTNALPFDVQHRTVYSIDSASRKPNQFQLKLSKVLKERTKEVEQKKAELAKARAYAELEVIRKSLDHQLALLVHSLAWPQVEPEIGLRASIRIVIDDSKELFPFAQCDATGSSDRFLPIKYSGRDREKILIARAINHMEHQVADLAPDHLRGYTGVRRERIRANIVGILAIPIMHPGFAQQRETPIGVLALDSPRPATEIGLDRPDLRIALEKHFIEPMYERLWPHFLSGHLQTFVSEEQK